MNIERRKVVCPHCQNWIETNFQDGKGVCPGCENEIALYPYPDNSGQTHYPGCYTERGHHNCAVELVQLFQDCLLRASRMYAEAKPDGRLVFPDGAKSLAMAMDELDKLRAAAKGPEYPRCTECGEEMHYATCSGKCVRCMAKEVK